MKRGKEGRGEGGGGGRWAAPREVSFAAGRPGDINKIILQKFDLVEFKSIKPRGFDPQGSALRMWPVWAVWLL